MLLTERSYQAFYTRSEPIVSYMVNILSPTEANRILEPCAGDGVFIEAILSRHPSSIIDAFEIHPVSIDILRKKFSPFPNVSIKLSDTLTDPDLSFKSNFGANYERIIANPPYGAWQDYDKRRLLRKLFPNLYVRETYSLFLYRCIQLLKEGGRLVFIIPDTFLNLHLHKALRKYLLAKTAIQEILLFPSSFFPGVSFGYANLCIITLIRHSSERRCLDNSFSVLSGFKKVDELNHPELSHIKRITLTQRNILGSVDHAFLLNGNDSISELINSHLLRIGDIAKCVTGFYSGNDKRFLRSASKQLRNGSKYNLVNREKIATDYLHEQNILEGIDNDRCFVPIVKGGNTKYLKSDNWYMDWSKEAVRHYKSDKKARFQNPQYYFKFGVGVPMVSSSQVTAALIENKLFDQSIVGIFPSDQTLIPFLLAFFNSPTCNKLIRTINPSANNPANYIKKVPFIKPNEDIQPNIDELVDQLLSEIKEKGSYSNELGEELNGLVKRLYGF